MFSDGGRQDVGKVAAGLLKAGCAYNAEILLLMNCCRSKGWENATPLDFGEGSQRQPWGKNTYNRSLTIIWASALGRPARDSQEEASDRCSSFMHGFLECVGHEVELRDVFDSISASVRSQDLNEKSYPLRQRPWFSTDSVCRRTDFFVPPGSRGLRRLVKPELHLCILET